MTAQQTEIDEVPRLVLVVDDEHDIRQLVIETLGDVGIKVVGAEHGRRGLELLETLHPELILLDMGMPVMDGWRFAEEYRRRPGPHAPIVCFTAAQHASQRADEIGAAAVLSKPFDLADLQDVVFRHAGGGAGAALRGAS